jgi:hypothetical protein
MSEYNLKFAPGCSEIYFNRINSPGTVETMATVDIWQVEVTPIVDFNGDGMVDAEDVSIIVEYWLTPEPLYDIGPLPLGDGLVDSQDLIVLADHLFEEVNDPTLVAHWPLDEQEGNIAYNSVSGCDGHLMGSPTWQPSVGIVAGALEFDGIDDYVMTEPVLNPVDAVFSVAIWVKGGAPGQAILSQVYGVNWLCTDSVYGSLMTELRDTARGKSLSSQTSITDNSWHRVGFVWDGSYRHLYVDGAEVATDIAPLSSLKGAEGGLYFGVSHTLAPKTFFSGLIDDVRIYNRVIIP